MCAQPFCELMIYSFNTNGKGLKSEILHLKHPNMVKFIDLLKSENGNTLRKLAIYIHKGFELRTRIYYSNLITHFLHLIASLNCFISFIICSFIYFILYIDCMCT